MRAVALGCLPLLDTEDHTNRARQRENKRGGVGFFLTLCGLFSVVVFAIAHKHNLINGPTKNT